MNRPNFDKLVKMVDKDVQNGDTVTIIFDSVSRMSRSAIEGIEQYFAWYNKGVELVFLNERYIDTAVFKAAIDQLNMLVKLCSLLFKELSEAEGSVC